MKQSKDMSEMKCHLCLRESSVNAVEEITYERFKEATDFVFTFEISYTFKSNESKVCQSCVERILEFYEYAMKVKTNQESARILGVKVESESIYEEECSIKVEPLQIMPDTSILLSSSSEDVETMNTQSQECDIGMTDAVETVYDTDAAENGDAYDSVDAGQSDKSPPKRRKRNLENALSCPRCNKGISNRQYLTEHMREHLDCHVCGKLFPDRALLREHTKAMHGRDRMMICDKCGKTFTKKNLRRHMETIHVVVQADPSVCRFCLKTFNSVTTLRSHIQAIHKEAGRTFTCDVCQKIYPSSRSLRVHKARVHVESKYSCTICQKQLKSEVNFREHMAAHTGVTLYECDVCEHKFNSKANMYAHIKRKHPVEWSEKQKNRVFCRRRRQTTGCQQ